MLIFQKNFTRTAPRLSRTGTRYPNILNDYTALQGEIEHMSSFDNREKDFENKFKHDQELQFKVTARRNRLFGEWAGGQMGLSGEALTAYAKDVVRSDFEKPGDEDVLEKVQGDMKAAGTDLTNERLRKQMDDLMGEAKNQVMAE